MSRRQAHPSSGRPRAASLGEITRQNADGRRTVERGVPTNFFVFYEIDEDKSKHSLSLDEY